MREIFILLTFNSLEEKEKFGYIYEKYKKLLLYKAYQILNDYALAEDAVSEAYLRIYKNLHKIDEPNSNQSMAFYVTITKNTALTILSKNKKVQCETYDYSIEDDFDLEEYTISKLSSETIYQLLNQLNDDLKSVFLLKYAYDSSHKQISDALGISENNVTVRVHRAKKKLAEILKKEGCIYEKR